MSPLLTPVFRILIAILFAKRSLELVDRQRVLHETYNVYDILGQSIDRLQLKFTGDSEWMALEISKWYT
jgi:hypothetical protein